MKHCCGFGTSGPQHHAYRKALWAALSINGFMFIAEFTGGLVSGSASLQADALDFLADTANYGISLSVVGLALVWRARAALIKGLSMGALGFWVAGNTVWHALVGSVPEAEVMGAVGVLALLANVAVVTLLFRYRTGDANMRSVWICSRNDVLGNVAVLLAAVGVFGTGTGWPDFAVAAIMASMAMSGGAQVIRQATRELNGLERPAPAE
jgi:Co/Zn/Cd efflux system component